MTLTFPRAMPAIGVGRQVFEIQRDDYQSPETGGRVGAITAGLPRWMGQWTLASALKDVQSDEWRAFISSLKGGQRSFLGRDYERPYPRLYKTGFGGLTRAGGGAFDGSATSWSQSVASDGQATLTLGGLPAGMTLSIGDYVGFRWTTGGVARRALVRLLEAATADGSGSAACNVEPAVPNLVPGGAVARLDSPECVMKLVTSQTQITDMDRRRVAGARIVAVEDLRA